MAVKKGHHSLVLSLISITWLICFARTEHLISCQLKSMYITPVSIVDKITSIIRGYKMGKISDCKIVIGRCYNQALPRIGTKC